MSIEEQVVGLAQMTLPSFMVRVPVCGIRHWANVVLEPEARTRIGD